MKKTLILLLTLSLVGCTGANVDWVKERADQRWAELGYSVVGYEGYQWNLQLTPTKGGACVWYELVRTGSDPATRYRGCLRRWGNELHMYGPTVVNDRNYSVNR